MAKQSHREIVYEAGVMSAGPGYNPRREKRYLRQWGSCTYEAFQLGQACALRTQLPPRLQRNPYPPGLRYDEWERGFRDIDALRVLPRKCRTCQGELDEGWCCPRCESSEEVMIP